MKLLSILMVTLVICTTGFAQSWSLNGNSGIAGNAFIGTTDNHPVQFRVNNVPSGFSGYDNNHSVAFGYWAYASGSGADNTVLGFNALSRTTSAFENTAIGMNAMLKTTVGAQNTAVGSYSLLSNVNGNYNIAIGSAALYSSINTSYNVAIGNNALRDVTSGADGAVGGGYTSSYNVAVGINTLQHNTTGNYNTGLGFQALLNNKTGQWNTAVGAGVLQNNTTGFFNTAVGVSALHYNTTGEQNTAIGEEAMAGLGTQSNTGSYNTALGLRALDSNATGSNNTAIGYRALDRNFHGSNNTAVGLYADVVNNSIYNGSILGARTIAGANNVTAVGFGAVALADNQVRLGNSSVTKVGGFSNWSSVTDSRVNKDIKADVPGLDFINKLNPVTYAVDIDAADNIETPGRNLGYSGLEVSERNTKKKKRISGFVAQEVETAANDAQYDFSGIDKPENNNSLYALKYAEFVVPLVKAVQELSNDSKKKDSIIAAMQEQITDLQSRLDNTTVAAASGTDKTNDVVVTQNTPNPFAYSTTIRYNVPSVNNSLYLHIVDANGAIVKQVSLPAVKGAGTYQLDAQALMSGIYFYALVVDGKQSVAKKMVLAR
ncbi:MULTISPECIES: T9SS type A sorting domain-containing protein [Chitinophagaceae]